MTSLSFSKWLACTLAFLVLAVIPTSLAIKCHICNEKHGGCIKEECPEKQLLLIGFKPSELEMYCVSVLEVGSGEMVDRACHPKGQIYANLVGGPGNCGEIDQSQKNQMDLEDYAFGMELGEKAIAFQEKMKNLTEALQSGGQITPDQMKNLTDSFSRKGEGRSGRASGGATKYRVCACKTDFCNDDGLKSDKETTNKESKSQAVCGFEFKSEAIIVLAAFACLLA